VALASNNLLDVVTDGGRTDEALMLGERAIRILTKDSKTRAEYLIELGKVYSNVGRIHLHRKKNFSAARTYMQRALMIHLALLGEEHFTTAIDINNLGTVAREEAQWAGTCGNVREASLKWSYAYGYFRRAIDIHRAVLPASDYRIAIALYNLGTAAYNLNRLTEAEQYFREAVEINDLLRDGAVDEGSDQMDALLGLGHALLSLGKNSEARTIFNRAVDTGIRLYGKATPAAISGRGAAAFALARPLFCRFTKAQWSSDDQTSGRNYRF
jgi:tetratricopeptide (TPR) repeat protein